MEKKIRHIFFITDMKFEDFLDYIVIKDKQGNKIPINKEEVLKRYEQLKTLQKTQRIRNRRSRKIE
jgi:hypothetical protein